MKRTFFSFIKSFRSFPHLELSDPCTVPVGLSDQLDKELPLGSALHGWWWWGVRWGIRSRGNRDGRRRLSPPPVEDLLYTTFDWWTLEPEYTN